MAILPLKPGEAETVVAVERYVWSSAGHDLLELTWDDGTRCICQCIAAGESDNSKRFECGLDAREEQFNALFFRLESTIANGSYHMCLADYFEVNYHNFPVKVVDAENGTVVYER